LANRFEARDFGVGAGRFNKRALQITIIGLHVNGNDNDGNNQQDQSHGSPFKQSVCTPRQVRDGEEASRRRGQGVLSLPHAGFIGMSIGSPATGHSEILLGQLAGTETCMRQGDLRLAACEHHLVF
jgi:hypothetical protein